MSWSYDKTGRAGKMAEIVKGEMEKVGGCPEGSAEEAAKNVLGTVAETLLRSYADPNTVVRINGQGSAWTSEGKAVQQSVSFKLETIGQFVE